MGHSARPILLTGATGYVGGRLRRVLEAHGLPLRCLVRRTESLEGRVAPTTRLFAGDVLQPESLGPCMEGVGIAYYLIHSMGGTGDFERLDRGGAQAFARAAHAAGVERIIYLGGLGPAGAELSPHLRSRQEVGHILASTGVPVIELRASIVLGSGSLSFEMVRALVERLPVMITPRWVEVEAQPIAVQDLLAYLDAARTIPVDGSRIFEIGGADRVSYGDIMREYARQRGLRRWMIRVPVMTPRLSSLWLGLVTPLYARVGRKLLESIRSPTVVTDGAALEAFDVRPCGLSEALARALRNEERDLAEPRWFDSLSSAGVRRTWAGVRFSNRIVDVRERRVAVPPDRAFTPIRRIGGDVGWYAFDWLWKLRGFIDLLLGGVGMRRGRRDPEHVAVGEPLDFWRVEAYEPDRCLRLEAEMKLPGRAWLELSVEPDDGGSIIRQSAVFDPVGLGGLAYWYGIYPLHALIFERMLDRIARAAATQAS